MLTHLLSFTEYHTSIRNWQLNSCFHTTFSAAKLVSLLSVDEDSTLSEMINSFIKNSYSQFASALRTISSLTPIQLSSPQTQENVLCTACSYQGWHTMKRRTKHNSSSEQKQKTVLYTQGTETRVPLAHREFHDFPRDNSFYRYFCQ